MPSKTEYQNHFDSSTVTTTCFGNEKLLDDYNSSADGGKAQLKPEPKPRQWFELSYSGRTLKYAVAVFGNQPRSGYPLYIGLHGGGTDKTGTENDGSWWDAFDRYYRIPVENQAQATSGAVFVAARGVSSGSLEKGPVDTWDLHSQPESYVLLERMIKDLLLKQPKEISLKYVDCRSQLNEKAKQLVNSDRVYLLGFSAGGDGVFQLSTKISDRFAAVNAGGGHPNNAKFANLANLPICIQVGEKDEFENDNGLFPRAPPNVEASKKLDDLRRGSGEPYYQHKCFVVKNGEHSEWSQPKEVDQPQLVLRNLRLCYNSSKEPRARDARDADATVINPVRWVSLYKRNPIPLRVVWDLSSRPPKPRDARDDWETKDAKRFFYWLFIRKPKSNDLSDEDTIRVSYIGSSNSIQINKPSGYLGILLNDDMLDLKKSIEVKTGGKTLGTIKVSPSEKLQRETLQVRGDTRLEFSAMIYFEQNAAKDWEIKTADSLYSCDADKPNSEL